MRLKQLRKSEDKSEDAAHEENSDEIAVEIFVKPFPIISPAQGHRKSGW